MLREYNGHLINKLTEAVLKRDEHLVDEILKNSTEEEINSGESPLFYISFDSLLEKEYDEVKRRIFLRILNDPKFTNLNEDFIESEFIKYPVLFKYLRDAGENITCEECALDLINSSKYKRINNIDGPRALINAIYGNYSYFEHRYSKKCIEAIINKDGFTNIGTKIFTNPITPKYKMSPLDVPSIDHDTIIEICFNDKFDSTMLAQNLIKLSKKLSNNELYELLILKGLPDNIEIRSNIMLKALKEANLPIIFALISRNDIFFNEKFYGIYYSYLRSNLFNIIEDEYIAKYIVSELDKKHLYQYTNDAISLEKLDDSIKVYSINKVHCE